MGAYDDNNWVQILKSLGLTDNEYADAKLLLAEKDAAYRKVMLGDDKDSNKNVILRALGESSLPLGYMGLLGVNWELYRVPFAACAGLLQLLNVTDTLLIPIVACPETFPLPSFRLLAGTVAPGVAGGEITGYW